MNTFSISCYKRSKGHLSNVDKIYWSIGWPYYGGSTVYPWFYRDTIYFLFEYWVKDIIFHFLKADDAVQAAGRSCAGSPGGLLDLQTACTSWMYTATEAETPSGVISCALESSKSSGTYSIWWAVVCL